jgi:hypothetical protein
VNVVKLTARGAFATFATEGTGFSDYFPGILPHLLTLGMLENYNDWTKLILRFQLQNPILQRPDDASRSSLRIERIMPQHPLPRSWKRYHDRSRRGCRESISTPGDGGSDSEKEVWIYQDGN